MSGSAGPIRIRAWRAALVSFGIAIAGGIAAVVGYALDEAHTVLGLGLAASLAGIGFGLVAWAKALPLDEHAVQDREPLTYTEGERRALGVTIAETRGWFGGRRTMLALLGGALGSLAIGAVGPAGSLGPAPNDERARTSWRPGRRLVTSEGTPIEAFRGGYGLFVTVFPDGAVEASDSQVVLMRLRPSELSGRTARHAVAGWVAYSKICTHAGCSVGLFGYDERKPIEVRELVCPCHQSVFDPLDAATPINGPATLPLPQLPLGVDHAGYLVALDDFDRPVGPLAWDEL